MHTNRLSSHRSLLLADDDDSVRDGVVDLFAVLGIEVFAARSGAEALELIRVQPVHAALLDWHMPGGSGLEALPRLRETRADLPCILYSGELTAEMERLALAAGAQAVLRKPVPPDLLRREVFRALGLTYPDSTRIDPDRNDSEPFGGDRTGRGPAVN